MSKTHNIYLVNELHEKKFWCFMQCPLKIDNYFLSSTVYQTVPQQAKTATLISKFEFSKYCFLGVGANPLTVQDKAILTPSAQRIQPLQFPQAWSINYPPAKEHGIAQASLQTSSPNDPNIITLQTNPFGSSQQEVFCWYNNLSYNLTNTTGNLRAIWAPDPNYSYELAPITGFYIYKGACETNQLLSADTVSSASASVSIEDFDAAGDVTVTLTDEGKWKIEEGIPL